MAAHDTALVLIPYADLLGILEPGQRIRTPERDAVILRQRGGKVILSVRMTINIGIGPLKYPRLIKL